MLSRGMVTTDSLLFVGKSISYKTSESHCASVFIHAEAQIRREGSLGCRLVGAVMAALTLISTSLYKKVGEGSDGVKLVTRYSGRPTSTNDNLFSN